MVRFFFFFTVRCHYVGGWVFFFCRQPSVLRDVTGPCFSFSLLLTGDGALFVSRTASLWPPPDESFRLCHFFFLLSFFSVRASFSPIPFTPIHIYSICLNAFEYYDGVYTRILNEYSHQGLYKSVRINWTAAPSRSPKVVSSNYSCSPRDMAITCKSNYYTELYEGEFKNSRRLNTIKYCQTTTIDVSVVRVPVERSWFRTILFLPFVCTNNIFDSERCIRIGKLISFLPIHHFSQNPCAVLKFKFLFKDFHNN